MTSRNTRRALRDLNRSKRQRSRARGRRLAVEPLEDRRLLALVDATFSWVGDAGYRAEGSFTYDDSFGTVSGDGTGATDGLQELTISFYDPSDTLLGTFDDVTAGNSVYEYLEFTFDTATRAITGEFDIGWDEENSGDFYLSGDIGFAAELTSIDDGDMDTSNPTVITVTVDETDLDYGDAPATYGTATASHSPSGPTLGSVRDIEAAPRTPLDGTGDDVTGEPDDEDGLVSVSTMAVGGLARAVVNVQGITGTHYVNAWIDFNDDGVFGAGEQIATNVSVTSNGNQNLDFAVPGTASVGATYARFRLSTASGLTATAAAADGEIEDHAVTLVAATSPVSVNASWDGTAPGTNLGGGLVFGVNAFATIQTGVNAVAASGTVNVAAGSYGENVTIAKSLTLDGTGTVEITPFEGDGIAISAGGDNVTIRDLSVSGAANGISASGVTGLTLINVQANNNTGDGIYLTNMGTVTLTDVTATGNDPGISVIGAASFSDTDGNYSGNADGGIYLEDISGNVTLIRTTLENNDADDDDAGDGLRAVDGADVNSLAIGGDLLIQGATIRDTGGINDHQEHGVYVQSIAGSVTFESSTGPVQTMTVTGNEADGVLIADGGTTASFTNGTYSANGWDGIVLESFSGAVTMTGVTASSNVDDDGVDLDSIGGVVTLTNMTIEDNGDDGAVVGNVNSLTISGGSFSDNYYWGINVYDVTGAVQVTNATIDGNGTSIGESGLYIYTAGSVSVDGGWFRDNGWDGIDCYDVTGAVTLTNVTVTGNGDDGVFVQDAGSVSVSGGTFSNNLDNGLDFEDIAGDVTVTNATASTNTNEGLDVDGAADVTVEGGIFSGIKVGYVGSLIGDVDSLTIQTSAVTSTRSVEAYVSGAITITADLTATTGASTILLDAVTLIWVTNATVTTNSGSLGLLSDDDITFWAGGNLTSTSGDVTVTADADSSGGGAGGALFMSSTSVINAGSGQIALSADENVTLGRVVTTNNTVSAIDIRSANGALVDGGYGSFVSYYIVATSANALVTLRAYSGIGSGAPGAPGDINTNVANVDAQNVGPTGQINLEDTNNLNVLQVDQTNSANTATLYVRTANGSMTLLGGAGNGVSHAGTGTITLVADGPNVDNRNLILNAPVTSNGGSLTLRADSDITGDANGDITSDGAALDGSISITADFDGVSGGGTIQLNGDVAAGTGNITFSLTDCDGYLNGNILSGANVEKNGTGALRLNGGANTYTGTTTVNGGYLLVNGVLNQAAVSIYGSNGGVFGGTGTVNATNGLTVYPGGILDPGDVSTTGCTALAGRLTLNGNLDVQPAAGLLPAGTFRVQLWGLTAGVVGGYDQLALNGTANLHGSVTDGAGGGELLVQPLFAVPVGGEFIIISNDLTELIGTRFNGLPEGVFLYPGGVLMNISYLAGVNDNDIVLTTPGRYDFNGYNGYTADNYMPVSPFTGYGGGNAAGWLTLPERYFERSYPVAPPYTSSDERLRYDGHSTNRSGDPISFRLDVVAATTYEVMILTGDVRWNHDRELFTATSSTGGSVQVQVDTWGAGAPDGSDVNVTWGGGTANPEGTGYYRWVRLTLQVGGAAYTTEQITVTMDDLGGYDSTAVILAMDVRPTNALGLITLERTASLNSTADGTSPFDSLPADGVTVDTYRGTGAPPNATITITVSAGTPTSQYTVVTTDEDPTTFGTQVTTNAAGTFTFSIQRPAALTNTPATAENWTILAEESSGLSRGTAIQEYVAPNAQALRFDFGIYGSPVQTYVANTVTKPFLEVIPQMLYNSTRGYGWSTRVAGAWRKDPTMSSLRTDLNYARDATFRVDLPSSGTYSVRVYHTNPRYYGTVSYIADNFEVYAEGSLMYTVDTIAPGTTWPLASSTFTVSVTDGTLDLRFRDIGGQDVNFVVSGIDISAGALPTDMPLLAAGDPQDGGAPAISADALQAVVGDAAAAWSARGLTPTQAATLANTQFSIADMGGAILGLANPTTNTIRIDDDAAMIGWSVVRGQSSWATGHWSLGSGELAQGRMTNDGVDLLTVVMHELGHLLGYEHRDDEHDLMAPVLPSGMSRGLSFQASSAPDLSPNLSLGLPRLSATGSSIEWRAGWFDAEDGVYAELGRDSGEHEADGDVSASLLESVDDGLLAAQIAKASEQPGQARVPRRSRLERFERDLDAWFAELAAEEPVGG